MLGLRHGALRAFLTGTLSCVRFYVKYNKHITYNFCKEAYLYRAWMLCILFVASDQLWSKQAVLNSQRDHIHQLVNKIYRLFPDEKEKIKNSFFLKKGTDRGSSGDEKFLLFNQLKNSVKNYKNSVLGNSRQSAIKYFWTENKSSRMFHVKASNSEVAQIEVVLGSAMFKMVGTINQGPFSNKLGLKLPVEFSASFLAPSDVDLKQAKLNKGRDNGLVVVFPKNSGLLGALAAD